MNKRDDQRGRAVPVQIPGARWGPCPPRDDVKTSSRGARIAGRGGEARVVEGRLAVLRRAFRAWKRRSSRAVGPALALARPLAGIMPVERRQEPRPRAREAAVGRERAGDLEPALPARRRGEPTALAASARPGRRASPPLPARRIRSRRHRSRVTPSRDGVSTILGRRRMASAELLPGDQGPCPPRPDVVRRWGRCFCAGARLHARLARLGSDRRGRWRRPGRRRGPPVRGDGSSRTVMGRYGSMRRGIADHCEDGAARGAPVATAVGGARGRCRNLVRRSPVERRFRPISMRN